MIGEVVHGVPQLTVLPEVRPQAATTGRLARAARRLVLLLDPAGAQRRAAATKEQHRVDIVPGHPGDGADGGAALVAHLPAEQAAACWHALDHHARGLRGDGDPRTICQLMADTLVERVTGIGRTTGRHSAGSPPAGSSPAGSPPAGSPPGDSPPAGDGEHAGPPPPAAQIHVVVKASTLLGADDDPADLTGHGPIGAQVARDIARATTATCRRVIVDEDGVAVTLDPRNRRDRPRQPGRTGGTIGQSRAGFDPADPETLSWLNQPTNGAVHDIDTADRFFTGDLRTYIDDRDGTCRMPVCDSPIKHHEHIDPHARGGRTTSSNGEGLSVRCHHLRDLPGWHVTGTAEDVM